MSYCLEIKNLCKSYENFALDNVSFNLPTGTIMGLVGKNGAGKTTTFNAILNLISVNSGEVSIFGKPNTEVSTKDDISVVFDDNCFSKSLTPTTLEKVMAAAYKNWDKELYFSYLNRLEIPVNQKIKAFSRGMTMKLAIAVSLSHKARLLIIDEATAGLDPIIRREILSMFQEFIEDERNSIIMATHITTDLEKIADYIVFLHKGRVILNENKDLLRDEYGIGRMTVADFTKLDKQDYISAKVQGLQQTILVRNRADFLKKHPHILVERGSIDEILELIMEKEN